MVLPEFDCAELLRASRARILSRAQPILEVRPKSGYFSQILSAVFAVEHEPPEKQFQNVLLFWLCTSDSSRIHILSNNSFFEKNIVSLSNIKLN